MGRSVLVLNHEGSDYSHRPHCCPREELQCYNCEGGDCRGPQGTSPIVECPSGTLFCELEIISGTTKKKCSSKREIPSDFKALETDPHKSCRFHKGGQEKHCLCDRDFCNRDYLPQPDSEPGPASSSPTIATMLVSTISCLLLAILL